VYIANPKGNYGAMPASLISKTVRETGGTILNEGLHEKLKLYKGQSETISASRKIDRNAV